MSDEELLKVVEDIDLKMVNEMGDEELLKAVKRIKSPVTYVGMYHHCKCL